MRYLFVAYWPGLFVFVGAPKLAFTAIFAHPAVGSRAAAISCFGEAATKALEGVPRAFFSRCHHSRL